MKRRLLSLFIVVCFCVVSIATAPFAAAQESEDISSPNEDSQSLDKTIEPSSVAGAIQVVASSTLPAIGDLNEPLAGAVVNGNVLVRGWFLDPNGVRRIDVLVDDQIKASTDWLVPRPDVQAAYPNYPNNLTCGFECSFNTSSLTDGEHEISILETSYNGPQRKIGTRKITVANAPVLPAMGEITEPESGQLLSGFAKIQGWFLDGNTVVQINVMIDGTTIGMADIRKSRPDILAAHPEYADANSGYEYYLDTTLLANGDHQLVVQEISNKNVKTNLPARTIKVQNDNYLPPIGELTEPKSGQILRGEAVIHGWFLDKSRVEKIEIIIDGQVKGTAQIGGARPDIYEAYPEYANYSSGYQYNLDTTKLSDGTHQIVIRETSKINVQTSLPARSFFVSNAPLPPKGDLNQPTEGQTVSGNFIVSGWFLDAAGIAKLEILVDGKAVGNPLTGLSRPDVYAAYPLYANEISGYSYVLDSKIFTNGTHKMVIRETSTKGVVTSLPARTINVANSVVLPAKGDLNGPAANQTVNGTIPVWGWFVDGNGVSKIEVLVDGKVKGTATKGLARPDVQAAFPAYADGNSGYEYALDTRTLTNGSHTIVVRETSSKGVATSLPARTIKVSNSAVLPAKGDLNGPTANQTVNGTIPVWGWFVDGNGVNKIEVLVDSKVVGTANKGLVRPDVLSAFPSYADGNSGYDYRLDTTKLSNGTHTIVVRETSNKGAVTSLPVRTITVSNAAILPPKGDMNGPTTNQTVSGTIPVWGWFVDGNGVSNIEVLVDGVEYADAMIGLSRPDVLAVYPEYQNSNSGFDYWLDTTKLNNGVHQITVREVSLTGAKATLPVSTVTINNP